MSDPTLDAIFHKTIGASNTTLTPEDEHAAGLKIWGDNATSPHIQRSQEEIDKTEGAKIWGNPAPAAKPKPAQEPESSGSDFWGSLGRNALNIAQGKPLSLKDTKDSLAPVVEAGKAALAAANEIHKDSPIYQLAKEKGVNPGSDFVDKITAGPGGDIARTGVQEAEGGVKKMGQALDPSSDLDLGQRVIRGVGGVVDTVNGGMNTVFAPASAAIEQVPGVRDVVHGVMGGLHDATQYVGKQAIDKLGIDPNSEQAQVLTKAIDTLGQLGFIKVAGDTTEALKHQSALDTAYKALDQAKSSGDVGAIEQATSNLEKATNAPTPTATGNAGAAIVKGTSDLAGKGVKAVGDVMGKASDIGKKTADFALNQATGLNPETIKTAIDTPNLLSEGQKAGIDTTRQKAYEIVKNPLEQKVSDLGQKIEDTKNTIFNTAKSTINSKLQELSDTGSGYKDIRNSDATIKLADKNGNSWFENFVKSKGLKIENGEILADRGSAIRSPAEIARLNVLYKTYGKYTKFTPAEFLNFRQDIGEIAKFGEGITSNMSAFAKDFYNKLNEKGRPQIQGLEAIDKQFSPLKQSLKDAKKLIYDKNGIARPDAFERVNKELLSGKPATIEALKKVIPNFDDFMKQVADHHGTIGELKSITKDLYDSSGNLKDNAEQTILNLFNESKKGKLSKLQDALPEVDWNKFQQQVKVSKALKDIEFAKGQKVGTYFRAGSAILGATGNIPALITSIIAQPDVVIGILKRYGELKGIKPELVSTLTNKVREGIKPSAVEAKFIQNAFKKTNPAILHTLIRASMANPKQNAI